LLRKEGSTTIAKTMEMEDRGCLPPLLTVPNSLLSDHTDVEDDSALPLGVQFNTGCQARY